MFLPRICIQFEMVTMHQDINQSVTVTGDRMQLLLMMLRKKSIFRVEMTEEREVILLT